MKEFQGQLLISTGAIQWTTDCSKALNAISGGNKTALKALKKKQVTLIGEPFHGSSPRQLPETKAPVLKPALGCIS